MANQLTVNPEAQAWPLKGPLMSEDTIALGRGLLSDTISETDRPEARSAGVLMTCMMATTAPIVDASTQSITGDDL